MGVLLVSSVSVAFFHALAPDHWLPFVALAKTSRWSMKKLGWIAFWAGMGHVASSLLLGGLGLWLGLVIHHVQGIDAWRSNIGIGLLIGFGADSCGPVGEVSTSGIGGWSACPTCGNGSQTRACACSGS